MMNNIEKEKYLHKEFRTIFITIVTCCYDLFWSIFQCVLTFKTGSLLFLASSLFSFMHLISKVLCLIAIKSSNSKVSHSLVRVVSALIILSGIFYMNYVLRVSNGEKLMDLEFWVYLAVSVFSTICMVMSLISIFKIEGTGDAYKTMKTMSCINTTSQFILALFTILIYRKEALNSLVFSIIGVSMGMITIFLGIYNFVRIKVYNLPK